LADIGQRLVHLLNRVARIGIAGLLDQDYLHLAFCLAGETAVVGQDTGQDLRLHGNGSRGRFGRRSGGGALGGTQDGPGREPATQTYL
jgi:hypothetical protein